MATLDPGMVVVCVDATTPPEYSGSNPLALGKIYRIDTIRGTGIFLVGVPCPRRAGFLAARFKPLGKADTDFLEKIRETV